MRRVSLIAILLLSAHPAFAQNAPIFRPLDSSMAGTASTSAPVPQVAAPASLPVAHNGDVIDSEGSGAIPSLPLTVMQQNGLSYLSGGVSDEETAQLNASENSYNLRLLVTGQSGEFVSDVTLTLKDASGNVLLTVQDAGPCVYTQVPAGKYIVDVSTAQGVAKSTNVTVPATAPVKLQIRV